MEAYCATCRAYYIVDAVPPYGVIHKNQGLHLHPITREELEAL